MKFEEKNLDVHFKYSGESVSVKLGALIGGTVELSGDLPHSQFFPQTCRPRGQVF